MELKDVEEDLVAELTEEYMRKLNPVPNGLLSELHLYEDTPISLPNPSQIHPPKTLNKPHFPSSSLSLKMYIPTILLALFVTTVTALLCSDAPSNCQFGKPDWVPVTSLHTSPLQPKFKTKRSKQLTKVGIIVWLQQLW